MVDSCNAARDEPCKDNAPSAGSGSSDHSEECSSFVESYYLQAGQEESEALGTLLDDIETIGIGQTQPDYSAKPPAKHLVFATTSAVKLASSCARWSWCNMAADLNLACLLNQQQMPLQP